MMMRMIIGTSLCVFRKEEKHGTSLPPELGCDQVIGVDMEVDVDLLIHAISRALEPQFRAEEPSMAHTTARHTRKWIVLLDHSAPFSTSQVPRVNQRLISFSNCEGALMLSDGCLLALRPAASSPASDGPFGAWQKWISKMVFHSLGIGRNLTN